MTFEVVEITGVCACGEMSILADRDRCAACVERDREYHRSLLLASKAAAQNRDEHGRFTPGYGGSV